MRKLSPKESFSYWVHNLSHIGPNSAAILGGNKVTFYTFHCSAILIILFTLISCYTVIFRIACAYLRKSRWDISLRFPLYISIADSLWEMCHLSDHIILLWTSRCPEKTYTTLISFNMFFFVGYQHLIHAGLAFYTYLKIVRRISPDLGLWEWKLHLFCVAFLTILIAIFYSIGSFGCSGYWIMHDVNSTSGHILGGFVALVGLSLATITSTCYISIRRQVEKQKLQIICVDSVEIHNGYHSVANQCLSTYVWIARGLYCSLTLAYGAFLIQSAFFGVVETTTAFVIMIISNSCGWANAWGYFYNERLKRQRRQSVTQRDSKITNSDRHSNLSKSESE